MAWLLGTTAADKLRDELQAFIEERFAAVPYVSQLSGTRWKVYQNLDPKTSGTRIVITTQADENPPWTYIDPDTEKRVIEEYHQLSIGTAADELSDGNRKKATPGDEKVFAALKRLFCTPSELEALVALGINEVREDAEAQENEGVAWSRVLNLRCNTDTFLE